MTGSPDWRRIGDSLREFPPGTVVHEFAAFMADARGVSLPREAGVQRDETVAAKIASLQLNADDLALDAVGRLYEALLADGDRKSSGSHYTPAGIADRLVTLACAAHDSPSRIADLSAGGGVFLVAAATACPHAQLVACERDPVAAFCTRVAVFFATRSWPTDVHTADGLTHSIEADIIVGNPPYLFGEHRDTVDTAAFRLAVGQWDTCWLFVERALRILPPGGRLALLLPDSILARDEPAVLRRHVLDRVTDLHLWHIGPAFDAGVSVVALIATRADTDHATGGRFTFERDGTSRLRDLDDVRADPRAAWLPTAIVPGVDWLSLGDQITISRGEEVGKKYLVSINEPANDSFVPVATGGSLARLLDQPQPTHRLATDRMRKPPATWSAPKVIAGKTGRTLRAGLDRIGLVTLQSAYNIRPTADAPCWLTPAFLCALLVSRACNARFIEPITTSKDVFPQITQSMIRAIRFPLPAPEVAARIDALACQGHAALDAIDDGFERLFRA